MSVHFSVPQFPLFRAAQGVEEQRQYLSYLARFEKYATTVVAVQSRVARELASTASLKEEIEEVRKVAKDMCARVLEMPVSTMGDCIEAVDSAVGKRVDDALAAVAGLVREGCVEEDSELTVGKWRVSNRRKKEKRRKMTQNWRRGVEMPAGGPSGCEPGDGASAHVSSFEGCSESVREELRDTRAKMLVEKNKLAAVRAEADRARLKARVQSRVDELELEERRIKLDAERDKRLKACLAKLPVSYAETMVSEGLESSVPSLSSSTVSPDSSISVAEVEKMQATVNALTSRIAELVAEGTEEKVKLKAEIFRLREDAAAVATGSF